MKPPMNADERRCAEDPIDWCGYSSAFIGVHRRFNNLLCAISVPLRLRGSWQLRDWFHP
jgi:hypothetical protein